MGTQQQLMKARTEEDHRSQAAADAKRWIGLKNIVEARALLKSLFKHALQQNLQVSDGTRFANLQVPVLSALQAFDGVVLDLSSFGHVQLYEAQTDACEAREENELLKVKLQAAESEVKDAKNRAVEAQLALAEALAHATPATSGTSPAPSATKQHHFMNVRNLPRR